MAARSCRRRASTTRTATRRARCVSKEDAHDYRYFPDPDLLPLEVSAPVVEKVRAALPEFPERGASATPRRYASRYDDTRC